MTALMVLGGTLFSVTLIRHFNQQRNAALKMWREAAQAAGFSHLEETQEGDFVLSPRLVATRGKLSVSFDQVQRNDKYETRVRISGLPPALTLTLETGATRSAGRSGHRDLEVGDDDFDDEVYVQGPATLVQAIMDSGLRLRVRSMLGSGVAVRGGVLHAEVPNEYGGSGYLGASRAPLETVLPLLVEFANRLMRPADVVDRLVASVKTDPVAGVRRASLLMLAREYPEHAATRPALAAALADPDDAVRLCAATLLAPEGTPVLLEIAGGENTDDGLRRPGGDHAGRAACRRSARWPS